MPIDAHQTGKWQRIPFVEVQSMALAEAGACQQGDVAGRRAGGLQFWITTLLAGALLCDLTK
jgi:hypothetical protein